MIEVKEVEMIPASSPNIVINVTQSIEQRKPRQPLSILAWDILYFASRRNSLCVYSLLIGAYASCLIYASLYALYCSIFTDDILKNVSYTIIMTLYLIVLTLRVCYVSFFNIYRSRCISLWCNSSYCLRSTTFLGRLRRFNFYISLIFDLITSSLLILATFAFFYFGSLSTINVDIGNMLIFLTIICEWVMHLLHLTSLTILSLILPISYLSFFFPYIIITSTFNEKSVTKRNLKIIEKAISSLPIEKYEKGKFTRKISEREEESKDEEKQNDICAICLEEFVENEDVRVLKCQHFYHVICIYSWLKKKPKCPICIQKI